MSIDRYASLKQGLVGCWIPSISGSGLLLPDLSGRGNNGTLTNMGPEDWVSGQYGRALDFDGVNDYVNLGSRSLSGSASTISAWVRLDALNQNQAVLDNSTNAGFGYGIHLRITSANVLRFWNYDANTNATGSTVLANNQWYHVSGRFNGSGQNSVFVNGQLDGQNTGESTNSVTGTLSIGTSLLLNHYLDGQLDDIRIYNRALTEPEIKLLASEPGIGYKPAKKLSRFSQRYTYQPPPATQYGVVRQTNRDHANLREGLVGAWCPSIAGSGLTLPDLSQRNNHGTLTNMGPEDWVSAQYGRALDFDGVNDKIVIPNNQSFVSGTQLTASMWVKRNAIGVYYELINKFIASNVFEEDGWLLRWDNNNKVLFTVAQSGSYGQYLATTANTSVTWNHVAIVHEFGTTAKTQLFVNGQAIGASWTGGTQVPDADATNDNIVLGSQFYGGADYNLLAGQLDDIRIYNRALTEPEIKLLASRPGIGLAPERRRTIQFQQQQFSPAWSRRQQLIGSGVY